jgi:hypothetical protein
MGLGEGKWCVWNGNQRILAFIDGDGLVGFHAGMDLQIRVAELQKGRCFSFTSSPSSRFANA